MQLLAAQGRLGKVAVELSGGLDHIGEGFLVSDLILPCCDLDLRRLALLRFDRHSLFQFDILKEEHRHGDRSFSVNLRIGYICIRGCTRYLKRLSVLIQNVEHRRDLFAFRLGQLCLGKDLNGQGVPRSHKQLRSVNVLRPIGWSRFDLL